MAGVKSPPPKTVDEYLAALPKDQRAALEQVRQTIRAAVPEATEGISYQIPAFKHHGALAYYAAWRTHLSLYGIDGSVMEQFKDELRPFLASKGTLRFTPEAPIPASLVTRLVQAHARHNEATRKKR